MERRSRVTLKDIAKVAGLSKSGVSQALRNDPSLPKATRERVQAIARDMGYRPDPALMALVGYRHPNHARSAETIAWVTNWPTAQGWRRSSPVYRHYFEGACRYAEEKGYRLEHLWMREKGMTATRFEQVLRARGIRGLILAPQQEPHAVIDLRLEDFAAVKIGFSLDRPALHTVTCSHFMSMKTVIETLRRRGYRRIGYCFDTSIDERVGNAWLAAYLLSCRNFEREETLPPRSMDLPRKAPFLEWLGLHRPDVIVTTGMSLARDIRSWCGERGLQVPGDIGVAVVSNVDPDGEFSGIHEHSEQIGAIAVRVLGGMLYANETGVPDFPQRILIDGSWVEGRTVRSPAEEGNAQKRLAAG